MQRNSYSGLLSYDDSLSKVKIATILPTQGFTVVAFDSSERYVTAIDRSHIAYLYDLKTQLIHRYMGNAGRPTYIATPTPGSPHVLVGDANGTIRVWDAPDTSAHVVMHGPAPLFAVSFSPDGRSLIANGAERIARYLDIATGAVAELRGHTAGVIGSRVAPDGMSALTYGYDGAVRTWRTNDLAMLREFRDHGSVVEQAIYIEGGKRVASVGDDGRLLVWPPIGNATLALFRQPFPLTSLAALPRNGDIVVSSDDGAAWDVALNGSARQVRFADGNAIAILRAAPDGSLLATGTVRGSVAVYSTDDWHLVSKLETGSNIRQIVFDPYNRDMLIASEAGPASPGRLTFVALNARRNIHWAQLTEAVRDVRYAPDGETLGFVCDDGSVWLYSIRDDAWAYANDHYTDTPAAAFSPDGHYFATSDGEGLIVIRDVQASLRSGAQHFSLPTGP